MLTYLVHRTTFSPVELTLLLLAHTVASVAFSGCSPSGPLPGTPPSLSKAPLEVLGGVSVVSIPDEDAGAGGVLSATSVLALLECGWLSGAATFADTCLLLMSLVLEVPGLGKEAGGSPVPGDFSVLDVSQSGVEASAPSTSWCLSF